MGVDLVSACVFCAGLLLGVDLPPAPGLQVEVGFSYATAARRYQIEPGRDDLSDVTPKFVIIGLGGARAAEAGLGADTPSAEWRLRVALAPSHDEQEQTPFSLQNTTAAGTGRYENFAIALRYPLGERDSLEAAADRRKHRATDLLDIEQERFLFSEQRQLSAERIDVGLGWRHRWPGLEAAVSGRYVRTAGSHATAGAFDLAGGGIYGAGVEGRARKGRWTFLASAELASGSIDVHEENRPQFVPRDFRAPVKLEAYRAGIGYGWRGTELLLQATHDRSRLPFVFFAVLGTEVAALESGFHPESRSRVTLLDLSARQRFAEGFKVKVQLRTSYGSETLTLTDSSGTLHPRRLDIDRSGLFGAGLSRALGGPEVSLAIGAEVAVPLWR